MRVGSKGMESGKARAAARLSGVRLDIITPRGADMSDAAHHYALLNDQPGPSSSLSTSSLLESSLAGTVGAKVSFEISAPYDSNAETLTRSAPIGAFRRLVRSESSGPRITAAELVLELNQLNAEIDRIMLQVEKAVARLTAS